MIPNAMHGIPSHHGTLDKHEQSMNRISLSKSRPEYYKQSPTMTGHDVMCVVMQSNLHRVYVIVL